MMPLTLAPEGEPNIIKKIGGNEENKQYLAGMGFAVGGEITVVATVNGSLIVNVKEARVALGKEMAQKIMI